ncbi:MAG: DMT family transporter [Betaproteobacteria bacterium]|nr:DMT family transporter [Betaproteobacteria bacterium]
MTPTAGGIGLAFAVLGAVGFSFKAILVKLAYGHGVDAVTLLALRMGFSLPFFLLLGAVGGRRAAAPLTRRDGLGLLGLGVFGYYLASFLDFLGLQHISAGLERLILFLNPAIVIVLSALFLARPVTRRALLSLLLCYAGVGLAVAHDVRVAGDAGEVLLGCALVFGSAVSYAIYLMGNGALVGRLGATRVTAWATTVASLLCIGQFLLMRPLPALVLPWQVYGLSALMAVFSTVLPVWLMAEAIRRIGATPVALTGTLGPVITIFLGWLMLGESVGLAQIFGAGLVIGGVAVMARR